MSPLSRKNIWLSQKKKRYCYLPCIPFIIHNYYHFFMSIESHSLMLHLEWLLGLVFGENLVKLNENIPNFRKKVTPSPSRNFRKLGFYNQNINWSEGFWHLYWKIKKELPLFRSCIIKICQVSKMKALIFKFGRFGYFCF